MLDEHIQAICGQYTYACNKHRHFADRFLSTTECLPHLENELAVARAKSDAEIKEGYSVQSTLNEEVLEAYEAYARGEYIHCIEELAQTGAVVLRAMDWITTKHLKGKSNE